MLCRFPSNIDYLVSQIGPLSVPWFRMALFWAKYDPIG